MEPLLLPNDIASLKRIIAEQHNVIAEHKAVIANHEQLVSQLQEQVRLFKAWRFAAKSEKAKGSQGETQYSLFDEAE